jgi:hypothetical protein
MKANLNGYVESVYFKYSMLVKSLCHFLRMLFLYHSFAISMELTRVLRAHILSEKSLKEHWLCKYDYRTPLRIEKMHIKELVLNRYTTGEFNYNPSIKRSNNIFEVYWRKSSYAVPLQSSSNKFDLSRNYDSGNEFEKIMYGTFRFNEDTSKIKIRNQKTLEIKNVHKVNGSTGRREKLKEVFYFSDPRLHSSKSKFITSVVQYTHKSSDNNGLFTGMALINRITRSAVLINSSDNSLIEKNWIVAKEQANDLIMLKSTNPFILKYIEVNSGQCVRHKTFTNRRKIMSNLNGGSPFVLVDNYYMRVARIKFSISNLGRARLSVLVKHDLNFREISRSRAFVFRETSIEICNGLDYDGSNFYFSWGENDRKMYFGHCAKEDLIDWYEDNLWK